MKSVSRKLAVAALVTLGVAACGDKVTVPPQTTVTPSVHSVTVSPSSATVAKGGTFTFGASVDADAGVARTVTWSAAGGTGVTVDQNGVASASATATGPASICAASTVDANVKGCAQLTVAAGVAPATVQIAQITRGCDPINVAYFGAANCGLNIIATPTNVAGEIDVTANVSGSPGAGTSYVVFQVMDAAGTTVQKSYSQQLSSEVFSNAEIAAQATALPVTMPISTSEYDLGGTGGAVRVFFTNGQHVLRVCISPTVDSCTGSGVSAVALRTLTFNNPNGFHVTISPIATPNANGVTIPKVSATAQSWVGGTALTINAIPVSYSGVALTSTATGITVNFGSGCNVGSAPTVRTANPTLPPAVAGIYSATFAGTGTAAATNVSGYEMGAASACIATGETPFATALDANGSAFVTTPLGGNFGANNTLNNALTPIVPTLSTVQSLRLDNRAPQGAFAVNINAGLNGRSNNWVNDAVVFNAVSTGSSSTANNMILNTGPAADAGFGGLVWAARVGTTLALATAAADITTPTGLARSATNATYCLIQFAVDGLGNRTAAPGACATTFGVDRDAPVIGYTAGSLANLARVNTGTVSGEFIVTVVDTGTAGNSGMAAVSPVIASLVRRNAASVTPSAAADCIVGTFTGSPATCTQSATGMTTVLPTSSTGITATSVPGYFTFNATAKDAAGNSAVATQSVVAFDPTAPIVSAAAVPATVTAIGYQVASFISEDLDIQAQWFSIDYTGAPVLTTARISQQPTQVNGFNAATLINNNFASSQVVNLPLAIQANNAAGLTLQASATSSGMGQSNLVTTGAAGVLAVTAPTAIALTNMTGFTAPTATFVNITTGGPTAPTIAVPAATVITTTVTGTTAIFVNPFSRIDFYATNQAATEYRFIGSVAAASAVTTDNGAVRTYTSNLSLTGSAVASNVFGAVPATFAGNIVAIGVNASGSVGMVAAASLGFTWTR